MVSQDPFEQEPDMTSSRFAGLESSQILWLIALGLIVLFIPFYFVAVALQNNVDSLQAELEPLETALALEPLPLPLSADPNQAVSEIQAQLAQITAVSPTLTAKNVNWPAALNVIRAYDPSQITLTGITQTDNQLMIVGRAVDDAVVVDYARGLESSGQFNRVVVQSIIQLPDQSPPSDQPASTQTGGPFPTPTPIPTTPAPTPTPGATWTPTPDLHDEFEWDDTVPAPIFLGQAQNHNFYPTFDVDNVTFLAKAGRLYQISTLNLAAGVDTFLTVTYGDTTFTNDDAQPGTLASLITVQAPGDADVDVLVRMTNRGAYGPSMNYQVRVREVVPTPSPTAVSPTPTTPTPTPSPIPTPDLRDEYEPDEEIPAPISVGETQVHTFYPTNDVDHLQFVVKRNRFYEVQTGNLMVGIDTMLTVSLGENVWRNDDYAPPGSGNLASAVCFASGDETEDLDALVTVENVDQQFAPNKTYAVSVNEVPQLVLDTDALAFEWASDVLTPLTQTVSILSTDVLAWAVETGTPWLQLDTAVNPATVIVSVDAAALPEDTATAEITFTWATACSLVLPVTLTVTDAVTTDLFLPNTVVEKLHTGHTKRTAFLQENEAVEFVILVEPGSE